MPGFPLSEWINAIKGAYDQYGYLIVFLSTFCENTALLGLFLPGNFLVLLGAFYARVGTLHLSWVIIFAWLGTVLGCHVDYLIGRFALVHIITYCRTKKLGRHLRLAGRIRLARLWVAKHGRKAILLSHVVGHVRSFVALSAGMLRMNYWNFLCFEMIAALLWTTAFSLLGYGLAIEIDRLHQLITRSGWIILTVLILLFLVWWGYRRKGQKHSKRRRTASRR
jgi:membrane protein DedA with SNARE-associated domain